MTPSPYLSMAEAGEVLRFSPATARKSAQRFLRQHGIPLCRRGKTLLVRRDVLERFIETGETGLRDRLTLARKVAS